MFPSPVCLGGVYVRNERGLSNMYSAAWVMFVLSLVGAFLVVMVQAWNAKLAVQEAAFEAARVGVASDDPVSAAKAAARNFARGTLPGWGDPNVLDVQANLSGAPPDTKLTVQMTYKLPVRLYNIVGTPMTWSLVGASTMRLEETP